MTQLALPFAVLFSLVLAGFAAGIFGVFCMKRWVRASDGRAETRHAECEAAIDAIQKEVGAYARQLTEIRHEPPVPFVASLPKPGLNLTRRSQALRLHRRGDTPEQIASALGVPLQEIDLLLKVHRIVIAAL